MTKEIDDYYIKVANTKAEELKKYLAQQKKNTERSVRVPKNKEKSLPKGNGKIPILVLAVGALAATAVAVQGVKNKTLDRVMETGVYNDTDQKYAEIITADGLKFYEIINGKPSLENPVPIKEIIAEIVSNGEKLGINQIALDIATQEHLGFNTINYDSWEEYEEAIEYMVGGIFSGEVEIYDNLEYNAQIPQEGGRTR